MKKERKNLYIQYVTFSWSSGSLLNFEISKQIFLSKLFAFSYRLTSNKGLPKSKSKIFQTSGFAGTKTYFLRPQATQSFRKNYVQSTLIYRNHLRGVKKKSINIFKGLWIHFELSSIHYYPSHRVFLRFNL
jgi:hypothetical protein